MGPSLNQRLAYDFFRFLRRPLYSSDNKLLTRTTGNLHLVAYGQSVLQESKQVTDEGENSAIQIRRLQTYNAFNEVDSETDGNGRTTNYVYNTMGKLTQKINPETMVVSSSGVTTRERTTTDYY